VPGGRRLRLGAEPAPLGMLGRVLRAEGPPLEPLELLLLRLAQVGDRTVGDRDW
jgi:hypothetical protein